MSATDGSPSYERRQALREADSANKIRVLDSYPLTKYFEIAERLLDAFQSSVDRRELDEAYVYGLRFAGFGVESLPKHKDWRRAIFRKQKAWNAKQVDKVISMMEIIKQRMDVEETILKERRRMQHEEKERQRRQRDAERRAMEEEQQKELAKVAQQQVRDQKKSVEQSALAKLQAMQTTISKPKHDMKPMRNHQENVGQSRLEIKAQSSESQGSKRNLALSIGQEKTEQANLKTATPTNPEGTKSNRTSKSTASEQSVAITASTTPEKDTSESNQPIKKTTPRSSKEQATIDLLQRTIRAQEKRLVEIETIQIPALLSAARSCLQSTNKDRKSALKCLARKKSLERQLDVIKAAIFKMETQMFMLENTLEDRQVQKALNEASQAIEALQKSVANDASTVDLTDLSASLPQNMLIEEEDDEELLEELREWLSPEISGEKSKRGTLDPSDDEVSILSLPIVPASVHDSISNSRPDGEASVRQLLKAVLG